jgi:hypothetical protein
MYPVEINKLLALWDAKPCGTVRQKKPAVSIFIPFSAMKMEA